MQAGVSGLDAAPPTIASLVSSSPTLRRRLEHPRFARPDLDVLLLDARYHLVGELRRALVGLGHRVWPVGADADAGAIVREVLGALVQHRPDFVLAVNHLGFDEAGSLGEVLATLGVPVAVWYVDSPQFVLRGRPLPAAAVTTLFTWERAFVPLFAPVCETSWLPLATDPELFGGAAAEASPTEGRPAFVGDSGLRAHAKWRARLGPEDEPAVAALEARVLARDPSLRTDPRIGCDPLAADRLAAATWRANTRHRVRFLEPFAPDRLVVHGDEGWETLLGGVEVRPGPNYGPELAHVYRSSGVNLNVTSLQMPTAVNQRVFDVPAAGGLLVTDAQEDLRLLFDDDEVLAARTPEEALDLARDALVRPSAATARMARARERILREHTYAARAERIIEVLRRRWR